MKYLFLRRIIAVKKTLFLILYLFSACLFNYFTIYASEKPEIFVPLGHSDVIDSLALSPNGKYLISASSSEKTMKLWDMELKKEVSTWKYNRGITSVIFTNDSNNVITGDEDGKLIVWDFKTWQPQKKTKISDSRITKLIPLPDGKNILISSHG